MRKTKPRILIVIGCLNLGGTEKHLLSILPKLLPVYDVSVYVTSYPGSLRDAFEKRGIKVYCRGFLNKPTKSRIKGAFIKGLSLIYTFFFFRRYKADVLHFFLPGGYILGGIAAIAGGQKKLLMSRRSQNDYQKIYPLAGPIEIRLHRYMRKIVANSNRVSEQLIEEGVNSSQLELLYNGVDMDLYHPSSRLEAKASLGLMEYDYIITIVANLFFYKGHRDLLTALSMIKDKLSKSWILLCVGRDEGEHQKLKKIVSKLALDSHVKFLGERSDVPEIIAASDMGVLPSHQEGFSNAILEFMASKKPMVVTDVGGNAEAVLNGEAGLVVAPKSPTELAAAILSIYQNPKQAAEFGEKAYQGVKEHFSLESCAKQYNQLYASVLASECNTTNSTAPS
jgi:glycosyltransferase involved in cell wall biosynthesis